MKLLIGITLVLAMIFTSLLISGSLRNSAPLEVVQLYCETSEKGDFEKIKNYTTYPPQEYWDAMKKAYKRYKSESEKTPQIDNNENSTVESTKRLNSDSNLQDPIALKMVSEEIPVLMNEGRHYIKEIKNVWIKGNEAKIRIILGSRDSSQFSAERDFFLYLVNGEWKIFQVFFPSSTDIYAMPEQ